jgi:hypothetical protein
MPFEDRVRAFLGVRPAPKPEKKAKGEKEK